MEFNGNRWLTNDVDYDILSYGAFCTPCLYGENAYSVTRHPSCVSYALSYALLASSFNMVGALVGNAVMPQNPYMILCCSSLFSSGAIGHFAGKQRTEIREKYGIDGTVEEDACVHFLCSPCGVCQEAQEIRERNKNVLDHVDYHAIPEPQIMK